MKANAHADAQKYMNRHAALTMLLPVSAEPFDFEMALGKNIPKTFLNP